MLDTDIEKLLSASDYLTDEARAVVKDRAELWVRCELDEKYRAAALRMCAEGTPDGTPGYLFFLTMFGWIYEARNPAGFQKLPFVPYPYQIREFAVIHNAIQGSMGVAGKKNVELWLKSRDMGLTWLVLAYFFWDFLFHQGSFHVGSRNEKEVDYLGETGTLFYKLRYLKNNCPLWMLPAGLEDKKLLLSYKTPDGGEVCIGGESANPEFGSGNRKKAILADEFSKWEHDRSAYRSMSQTSNCLLLVGTPKGYGNFYAEIARGKAKIAAGIHRVHWTEHPLKTKDLSFVDGKATSSWYRDQASQMEADMVAGELDLSFESSLKGIVFAGVYGIGHQKTKLKPLAGAPITVCWDLGGVSAVLFIQVDKWRRVRVLKEIVDEDTKLSTLAQTVLDYCEHLSRQGHVVNIDVESFVHDVLTYEHCGDPAGASMTKTNQEVPEYQTLFDEHQISVDYLYMAAIQPQLRVRARIVAIENCMLRHIASGVTDNDGPAFWIDTEECPILDEALRGGYRRKIDLNGNVMDVIDEKHPYEDVVDALGYGIIYKLGVPQSIRVNQNKKSEEQREDNDEEPDKPPRRTRC